MKVYMNVSSSKYVLLRYSRIKITKGKKYYAPFQLYVIFSTFQDLNLLTESRNKIYIFEKLDKRYSLFCMLDGCLTKNNYLILLDYLLN